MCWQVSHPVTYHSISFSISGHQYVLGSMLFIFLTPGCPAVGMLCLWLRTLSHTSAGTQMMWPSLHIPALSLVQASLSSFGLVRCTELFFWSSISRSNVKEV